MNKKDKQNIIVAVSPFIIIAIFIILMILLGKI